MRIPWGSAGAIHVRIQRQSPVGLHAEHPREVPAVAPSERADPARAVVRDAVDPGRRSPGAAHRCSGSAGAPDRDDVHAAGRLPAGAARAVGGVLPVLRHGALRTPVVRLLLPADRADRGVGAVDRGVDRGRPRSADPARQARVDLRPDLAQGGQVDGVPGGRVHRVDGIPEHLRGGSRAVDRRCGAGRLRAGGDLHHGVVRRLRLVPRAAVQLPLPLRAVPGGADRPAQPDRVLRRRPRRAPQEGQAPRGRRPLHRLQHVRPRLPGGDRHP